MVTKPDHGFAYVILLASFIGHIIIVGICFSLGLFYVEFREVFWESKGSVALVSSLNAAFLFLTAPVSSILTKKFGPQAVCFTGGLLSGMAFLLSAFASNLYTLYITFGVFPGTGLGLSFLPVLTILGEYFIKRRSLAIGLAVSGGGVGNLAFPPLIQYLLKVYSWQGSCLILSGLTLNLCVIGMLLKPITKIDKVKQISKEAGKSSIEEPEKEAAVVKIAALDVHSSMVSLQTQDNLSPTNSSDFAYKLEQTKNPFLSYLDLCIFKNGSFLLLCVNNLCIYFAVMMIFNHLSAYAINVGLSPYQGSFLLSFTGIGNFLGRIITGIISHFSCVSEASLYVFEFFVCAVIIAAIPMITNFGLLAFISMTFGMIYGSMITILPQIVIRILDLQHLLSGYGYLSVFGGIGNLVGSPVAEFLFDQTGVYTASFYLAGAMLFLSSLLMIYPWLKMRKVLKKEPKK